ncbi:MAG: FRG domain-containing protein [Acidobacteriia bacterium]|nr:FRG domain-containing protein [Terriglobia bacterium]
MAVVVVRDCEGADDFLDQLSPRGEIFGGTESGGSRPDLGDAWIFRGVSDDSYLLIPSALRNENSFLKFGGQRCTDNDSQIRAEIGILRQFFNLADANGLPLPEDSQTLRGSIQRMLSEGYFQELDKGEERWPPRELWSLLGIGQHYGIPTCLLDWSRRPLIAAYFAAQEAAQKLSEIRDVSAAEDKKLCVWAFAVDRFASRFDKEDASFFGEQRPPAAPIVKVTAPHAHNPNLHAQDGLFTVELRDVKDKLNGPIDRKPLDEIVGELLSDRDMTLFHRIRLPWLHAPHLMWRLRQENLNRATVFPGYAGVVQALEEEARSY